MADAGEPEIIDVVASAGDLDGVIVLLREFLHRSGALSTVVLFADPAAHDDSAVMIDCTRLQPIEITRGDVTVQMPHAIELDALPIAPVPDVKQLPPFEVDASNATIASPLGGVEHHALAVRAIAAALGEGAVALATFQTTDGAVPLSITARVGDPFVLCLGEDEYEMAQDWPSDPSSDR